MSRLRRQAAAGSGVAGDGDREPLDSTASIADHDADPVEHRHDRGQTVVPVTVPERSATVSRAPQRPTMEG